MDQNIRTNGSRVIVEETGRIDTPDIRTIVAEATGRAFFPGKPFDEIQRKAREWGYKSIIPRADYKDAKVRPGRTTLETIRIMCERDPDASKAMLNFLLFIGQGYESKADRGKDQDGNPIISQRAQTYVEELDTVVGEEYGGGMDQVIYVLARTVVQSGAMALWAELSEDLRAVIDFHPIDPADVVFRREEGTGRLMRGISVSRDVDPSGFLELNPEQFRYIPFMPNVNAPYGYPPFLSAIAPIMFKVEILDDLRAVVHNQGYPRLDITVLMEKMVDHIPGNLTRKGQEEQLKAYVRKFVTDVANEYKSLNPDDSFVHSDTVQVDYKGPSGSMDFKSLSEILDSQIVAGVKQLPIMLGRNEGATTTHATIQWRIQALQIGSFQRIMKRMIEWAHNLALRVAGMSETVTVSFESQPVGDRNLEAQARSVEIDNEFKLADRNWITEDEGSNEITGHPAVGPKPEPPAPTGPIGSAVEDIPPTDVNPDTGDAATEQARYTIDGGLSNRSQEGTDGDHNDHAEDHPVVPEDGERRPGDDEQAPDDRPGVPVPAGLEVGRTAVRDLRGPVRDAPGHDGFGDEQHQGGTTAHEGDHGPQANPGLIPDFTRLESSDAAISDLASEVQPSIVSQFEDLARDFPSGRVARGEITPEDWFSTEAGQSWTGRFTEILNEHYVKTFNVRGSDVLDELGVSGTFFLKNPDLLRILDETALTRVTGMNEHTSAQLRDILAEGLEEGTNPRDIAQVMTELIAGMTGSRAETIARTETAHVFSYSAMEGYRRNGVKRKIWLTAGDDRVDPPCPSYGDEGSIPIDDLFGDVHDHPPAHPRCRCAIIADLDSADIPDEPWTGE